MSATVTDDRTAAFLRVLDPFDNTTGGGTASAIAGSMAGALAAMVARLSLPPVGPEPGAYYREIIEQGSVLAEALFAGAAEDTRSFDAVVAAYRLPKITDADKAARRAAIQEAMVHATRVPLRNAELCAEVLALVARLEGCSNPRALSDLQSAGYLAHAGLQGCLANVAINLPGVKDPRVAEEIRARVRDLSGLQNLTGLG